MSLPSLIRPVRSEQEPGFRFPRCVPMARLPTGMSDYVIWGRAAVRALLQAPFIPPSPVTIFT